jgi:hypothetical protein
VALEADFDPRSMFYLAQCYRDLGYAGPAADMYRLRVRWTASHPQERFWACYQEGLIRSETDWERGLDVLLEAYNMRPTRCEPLVMISRGLRNKGWHQAALVFADRACAIPRPPDTHFTLVWMYEWGALQERAICRLAVGDTVGALEDFTVLATREDDVGVFARGRVSAIRGVGDTTADKPLEVVAA